MFVRCCLSAGGRMKKGEILVLAIVGVVCAGPAAGNQTSMKRVLSKTGKTNLVVPSSNYFFLFKYFVAHQCSFLLRV